MYRIIAKSTGNVLEARNYNNKIGFIRFFTEEEAWDYLEERYTKVGLNLWNVEKI